MFRLSRSTLPPCQCRRLRTVLATPGRSIQQSVPTRAANPYPFPKNARPTPHQIFHLPHNASQGDIKARYYDLVRIYHPDKGHQDLTPEAAHTRFQTITAAYDALRGKTPLSATGAAAAFRANDASSSPQTTTAWRARSRREALYSGGDDRWKDRVILAGVIATVAILVIQTFTTRRQALAEAVAAQRRSAAASRGPLPPVSSADPDSRLSA